MNVTFEATENKDGTWRVVMSRPGHVDSHIQTFKDETEATDWIERKAGDCLKRLAGDI